MPDLRTGNARSSLEITTQIVRAQVEAMGADVFELGLFRMDAAEGDGPPMLPRTWDVAGLMRSIPWLRLQNAQGRNIYIRPQGEHNLTLIDDLKADAVEQMKHEGYQPALVVETSPGNFQAWLKHPERLPKEIGTAAARALAERFDGDRKAADWRHFGRLAGFTNRKPKYQGVDGRFPFVRMIEASGASYQQALGFLSGICGTLAADARRRAERAAKLVAARNTKSPSKTIEAFRSNPIYGGDGTRIDLAYAVYALSHGAAAADIREALSTRDLSHKGNERRQHDYVERTIKKANTLLEGGRALSH
jgi:hypothetical protein